MHIIRIWWGAATVTISMMIKWCFSPRSNRARWRLRNKALIQNILNINWKTKCKINVVFSFWIFHESNTSAILGNINMNVIKISIFLRGQFNSLSDKVNIWFLFSVMGERKIFTNFIKWDTDDGPYQSPGFFPESRPSVTSAWMENGLFFDELSPNHRIIFRCILSSCVECNCESGSQRQLRPRKWHIIAWASNIWPLRSIQPQPQSDV